ncbi:unnamed protein product [Cyprideis torosa]|uniref:Uncharacterized protein n=1 Tax=Cyprideis torosa TaxID=163714 RepID=A0A7R8WAH6_9CRUS|nr:unnamed protein product [Cyprideis torosa]CAG0890999.1 unnamed protein product [Cyprideis torosa]
MFLIGREPGKKASSNRENQAIESYDLGLGDSSFTASGEARVNSEQDRMELHPGQAEGKGDPRLEEPVNDVLSKESISPSESSLVLLTSSEERKRKRHGTKRKRNGPTIPKQSKAIEGHNCER